ncbi:hypothetical protein [Slackia heliotrinireducens]|uniref:DUF4244 domain-containing protein n=1 Tax=Slackia heliotrinireducens (strain ATCC 29202 / DSM 20476 / NCTC 11029 / RHS 1) TaxID=471855 RepID=C7N7Z2_SLAHD|nr:hypothetical protein [Slackia heliotrinireducens]ACV23027.1 hypothetical protein Shel_20130 [Slackia heliotrinireducens DSM 20476]
MRSREDARAREGECGQSTVEYAVVASALASLIVGMGAIWKFFADGRAADLALVPLTHRVLEGLVDALLF